MTDALDFSDVYSIVRGCHNAGRIKLANTGVVFKSTKTGKVESIPFGDIESVKWMKVARGYRLKVVMTSGYTHLFDGFKEAEFDSLKEFLSKNYSLILEEQELSVKGWNWGSAEFSNQTMAFNIDKKTAFEIPLRDVSQAVAGKNEVTIEFHQAEEAKVFLCEMRFHIPNKAEDQVDGVDPVEDFHQKIMQNAEVIQATGDAIVTFDEVACLTPRGRYSIRVYPTFIQLHGKTYDYKMPHTTILRLFLLPHHDNRFMFFVVSLDPPIRQGQTRYPYLILQFERDEEVTCKLNLTEDEIENKYNNKLKPDMTGALFEVASRILKEVTGKKITVPGSFKSKNGHSSITASYKAASGLLYPLERGFIFVHKPALHIRHEEIANINFARGSTTGRTFDIEIELKNGTQHTFNNLPRDEYTPLFDYVNSKKLRIKNKGADKKGASMMDDLIGSDDDDHDFYLERMKAEGQSQSGDEDSEDEDDSDFNPENEKEDDVKEDFDSDPETSSESDSDMDPEERKKKKERKLEKAMERAEKKERKGKGALEELEGSDDDYRVKSKKKKSSSGGGSKKGEKKVKDPNAPKRPMSAYFLWLNDNRERIKSENPGCGVSDVAKIGGAEWGKLDDKSEWDKKAEQAKADYEVAYKEYQRKIESGELQLPKQPEKTSKKKSSPSKRKSGQKSIKDMMGGGGGGGKGGQYKSAEYIETSDSDSDEDEKPKAKKAKKSDDSDEGTSKPKKDDDEDEEEDEDFGDEKKDDEEDGTDGDDESEPENQVPDDPIRSRRGKANTKDEELQELPEDESEGEAEFSGDEPADSTDEDD